jgi:hypothetical protein
MKTSVLICAEREPALLPRIVRVLYWQGVFPELLHIDAMAAGTVRIRLEVECDEWRLRRLRMHWERIIGVQSMVMTQLDGIGELPPGSHLAPAAR